MPPNLNGYIKGHIKIIITEYKRINFIAEKINHLYPFLHFKGGINEQDVTISIYNILGRLVKIVEGENRTVVLDISDLSTGINFYQLKTNYFVKLRK
ncbi:MAG: T9SS type A sorting domain-containing protein [Candidatus Cloacimonetes bacterium]|nr:T9SS type A sorting domain-containing protein [Candidatus Cloacimonadota bacterium]